MSTPQILWVDSIKVGNSTAKALLRFLASHNFQKPGIFFKNESYMNALEISERTLQRAFDHLEKNKFITRNQRFDKNGRQIENVIYLNIPKEFHDDYEKRLNNPINVGGGRQSDGARGVNLTGGGRQSDHPLIINNNNKYNNKKQTLRYLETKPLMASPTSQSTSFDPSKPGRAKKASALLEEMMSKIVN